MHVNIVKPYARIEPLIGSGPFFTRQQGMEILRRIEKYARISHRSDDNLSYTESTDDRTLKFLNSVVLNKGDWSVTEHASLSVIFNVDRGLTHEIVRHRLCSYTQESTRFVNYTKNNTLNVVQPTTLYTDDNYKVWNNVIQTIADAYENLVNNGIKAEIARSLLPCCLLSKIVMTCNMRSWRHFFLMRTTKQTHPQLREITIPLLYEFKCTIPLLYDDISPEESQSVNLTKPE